MGTVATYVSDSVSHSIYGTRRRVRSRIHQSKDKYIGAICRMSAEYTGASSWILAEYTGLQRESPDIMSARLEFPRREFLHRELPMSARRGFPETSRRVSSYREHVSASSPKLQRPCPVIPYQVLPLSKPHSEHVSSVSCAVIDTIHNICILLPFVCWVVHAK
jgi:hypothetical protein